MGDASCGGGWRRTSCLRRSVAFEGGGELQVYFFSESSRVFCAEEVQVQVQVKFVADREGNGKCAPMVASAFHLAAPSELEAKNYVISFGMRDAKSVSASPLPL